MLSYLHFGKIEQHIEILARCPHVRAIFYVSFLLVAAVSLAGCEVLAEPRQVPEEVRGMAPLYTDSLMAKIISTLEPRPIQNGGGFVELNDTLYIVEQLNGVHLFDNADPANPVALSYISIPGCNSVAIIGNFLYVNNFEDLVTLDVSDPFNAIEIDREANLYPRPLSFPENYVGYFSCYDPSQGLLTGWNLELIETPQCFVE